MLAISTGAGAEGRGMTDVLDLRLDAGDGERALLLLDLVTVLPVHVLHNGLAKDLIGGLVI